MTRPDRPGAAEALLRPALMVMLVIATAPVRAELAPATETLYVRIAARLALMQDVAAYKFHHRLDVEDREREAVVVQSAVAAGLRHGLVPHTAERFYRVQIEAAKDVQRYWLARWQIGEPPPPGRVPDLDGDIRLRLLALGEEIAALAAATHAHDALEFFRRVKLPGLDGARARSLFAALADLRTFTGRLAQIRSTGVLRVGTTGDYAPFSYETPDGAPVGVDVDLATNLARYLGVRAVFVPTSWPRLMEDLASGSFDLAMGGVSITEQRRRVARFSIPYYTGGKTLIARCVEAHRFKSLADVDRAGVRVIVNPGGTNQRFVDARIRRAQVIRHPDNRTIFDEVVRGSADVMITDRIEVALQTALRPELCAPMKENLNRQQKAYLMPLDFDGKLFVDDWLYSALRDGTVAAAFNAHGVGYP